MKHQSLNRSRMPNKERKVPTVQVLNRTSTEPKVSGSREDGLALNQLEGVSKWVWLPMNNDKADMSRLLIQIETAAQEMSQLDTSISATWPFDSDAVFKRIANEMIKNKSESDSDATAKTEKDNANTA